MTHDLGLTVVFSVFYKNLDVSLIPSLHFLALKKKFWLDDEELFSRFLEVFCPLVLEGC